MTICIVIGAIIGWVAGVAQMAYMGSHAFFHWPLMLSFPAFNAAGFAIYGMILGGSGLFSKRPAESAKREHAEVAANAA